MSVHTFYVPDAAGVQEVLAKEIAKARNNGQEPQPRSFFAVAPIDFHHEKHIGEIIRRVLLGTNHRVGADRIIRQADNYSFFVSVGAQSAYLWDLSKDIDDACKNVKMRYAASVMYLPQGRSPEERARDVYTCLNEGIAIHQRKLPIIHRGEISWNDVRIAQGSSQQAALPAPSPVS